MASRFTGVQPGQLRHLVIVEENQPAGKTPRGEPIENWVFVCQQRMCITPLSGNALQQAQQLHVDVTHEGIARFNARITEKCRLKFNGAILNVLYVTNTDNANRQMALILVERKS